MTDEKLESLIAKRNALEEISNRHEKELKDAFINAASTSNLSSEEKIRKEFDEKIDQNRDLQIGIVGRVKAGKSSLLNALLFNGETILPKAATPMTAALTVLSYAEQIEVKIKFFEQSDIDALKERAAAYERKLKERTEFEIEELAGKKAKQPEDVERLKKDSRIIERAASKAESELKKDIGLSGAYDQYQMIKNSSITLNDCGGEKILHPQQLSDIARDLGEYVGSAGKYMPFTQSVEIAYPNEDLKGIRIIDTPGFNDPVPSREERAYQLLKTSDVILILSPAGNFMSQTDTEVLEKLTNKEGLRELFVVASKMDDQLLGDEYEDMSLDEVCDDLKRILGERMNATLTKINQNNVFDQLIEDKGARIILSSGDCQSMYLTFSNKDHWDDGKNQIWDNLSERFRDYFNDKEPEISKESLKKLGNINLVVDKINEVKTKKGEILAEKGNQLCVSLTNAVEDVLAALKNELKRKVAEVRSGNLANLQNERQNAELFCAKLEPGITRVYQDVISDWKIEASKNMLSFVNAMFNESRSEANESKSSFTRTHSYKSGGFLGFFQKTNYYETQHTRVSVAQVRSSIEDFIGKVNVNLKLEVMEELEKMKKKISSKISMLWAERAAEQSYDVDTVANKIRVIIEGLNLPDFTLPEKGLPSTLTRSGCAEDSEGEQILSEGKEYLSKLSRSLQQTLTDEIERYAAAMKRTDMAGELLAKYKSELQELIQNIQNKEETIKRFETIETELGNI
ncbi:MAG: dynamin family protein [Fibrobacteraceae bacterium]|nr:dynamin family protein [Fibrobacteraceae bacterium]